MKDTVSVSMVDAACAAIADLSRSEGVARVTIAAWRDAWPTVRLYTGNDAHAVALLIGSAAAASRGFNVLQPGTFAAHLRRDDALPGNERPGDGRTFRRRGYLGDRSRARYSALSVALGVPLVRDPRRLAEPWVAWMAAAVRLRTRIDGERVTDLAARGEFGLAARAFVEGYRRADAVALVRRALEVIEGG